MTDLGRDEGALSERLVDELQRRILDGTIPVGSWLRHSTIAQEFGMSRTPVREALHILNARGIVTIVKNRGARVNGHSSRELRELGEVRAELEGFAAELAVDRIDDEQLARMQKAVEDFAAAVEEYALEPAQSKSAEAAARWSAANEAFHGAIVAGSGNWQLALSVEDIGRRLPRNSSFPLYSGNLRLLRQNLAEHQAVADAIIARDARKARQAMVKHIRSASAIRVRYLEAQEPTD